jgi:(2Fe-2S) ferredoxin
LKPDAILFAISQYNLSGGAQKRLAAALEQGSSLPMRLVRMEGPGQPLGAALDALVAAGHCNILVQPLGLPFPESLRAWLPGAIGHWLAQSSGGVTVLLGKELADISDILAASARSAIAHADEAEPASAANMALGKPGWQDPPDFKHHLIVCTGPRCAYRDAASLLVALKDEVARQKVSNDCLTTRTGCMFPCNQGPMVAVYPKGEWYRLADAGDVTRFVQTVLVGGRTEPDLLIHTARLAREPA